MQNGTVIEAGSQFTLNGRPSISGYDSQPCPISNYAWLLEYQNETVFGAYSGENIALTIMNPCTINVTLIVTAPDVKSPASLSYINTSIASVWIHIVPIQELTKVDIFTNKGGVGPNATSPGYIPDELIHLNAYVSSGGASVANKQVVFTVLNPNGVIISIRTAFTNSSGYAYQEYRTPEPNNGTTYYGIWCILASVEVSQKILNDTVSFPYGPVQIISGISVSPTVSRGSSMWINITLQDSLTPWSVLTITIYDNATVPIYSQIINSSTISANTVSTRVPIPNWAFVGTAKVYVNVLTNNPLAGGVPVCPERSTSFQILA
jgi:hypothetical protein